MEIVELPLNFKCGFINLEITCLIFEILMTNDGYGIISKNLDAFIEVLNIKSHVPTETEVRFLRINASENICD